MRRGPKRDVAQEITNLIIARIEAGTMPWRRPWKKTGAGGAPLRAGGLPYTGINRLYLWAVADCFGYALDWRNRCYAMLRLKERKVADGDILRLPEPLRFTDGSEHREFRVSKRGSKIELRTPDGFGAYRISRLMERRFEIIRPARRIKTFFPIAQ